MVTRIIKSDNFEMGSFGDAEEIVRTIHYVDETVYVDEVRPILQARSSNPQPSRQTEALNKIVHIFKGVVIVAIPIISLTLGTAAGYLFGRPNQIIYWAAGGLALGTLINIGICIENCRDKIKNRSPEDGRAVVIYNQVS